MNVEKAFEEFTCWGISQVSLGRHLTKSVELRAFLEAVKKRNEDGDTILKIQYADDAIIHFSLRL